MKVLVIEDDLALADVLAFTLRREGYEVVARHDGLSGIDAWAEEQPNLVILDLNLPKLDGFAVCQRIRAQGDTPIIILSVRGEDDDVVHGLKLGADDYIAKPFSPRQFIARVEAVARRAGVFASPGPLSQGGLTLDPSRNELQLADGQTVSLTSLECKLLKILMINHGQVLPAETVISAVWGPEGADRTVLKQLVYRLRKKIETDEENPIIDTVPGVGYTFSPPSS